MNTQVVGALPAGLTVTIVLESQKGAPDLQEGGLLLVCAEAQLSGVEYLRRRAEEA